MPDLEFTSEERSEGMSFKPVSLAPRLRDRSSECVQPLELLVDCIARRDLN
jgi:hypothetical protein